jgi:hypothetical protein
MGYKSAENNPEDRGLAKARTVRGERPALSQPVKDEVLQSPFQVIFGLLWSLTASLLCFALPFILYFLPLIFFPNYSAAEPYISREQYDSYREGAHSFFLSANGPFGILFIVVGLALSFFSGITSLYGKTSWRLFLLVLGFALCCVSLRFMEIDFNSETIAFSQLFELPTGLLKY